MAYRILEDMRVVRAHVTCIALRLGASELQLRSESPGATAPLYILCACTLSPGPDTPRGRGLKLAPVHALPAAAAARGSSVRVSCRCAWLNPHSHQLHRHGRGAPPRGRRAVLGVAGGRPRPERVQGVMCRFVFLSFAYCYTPRGERTRDRALRDCHDFVLSSVHRGRDRDQ